MSSPTARDILDKALKRKEELRIESEALDHLIATYRSILGVTTNSREGLDLQPDLYRGMSPRAVHSARVAEMVDAARRMMIAERRPMKRGELVKKLEAQGFSVEGADKNKVFGTNLWRSGKFIAVKSRGYWPRDVELPSESPGLL